MMISALLVMCPAILAAMAFVAQRRPKRFRALYLKLGIFFSMLLSLLLGTCSLLRPSRSEVCYGPPEYFNNGKNNTEIDSLDVVRDKDLNPRVDVEYGPPEAFRD